ITSLLITIFFGKLFIKKLYELKIGDRVRSEECPLLGELHRNKNDTPTMGGILILFSLLVSLFLWMDLKSCFTLLLLLTTVVAGVIGGFDDYLKLRYKSKKGLSPRKKMVWQFGLAAFVTLYLLCPSLGELIHFGDWFQPPIAKEQVAPLSEVGPVATSGIESLSMRDYVSRLYVPFVKRPLFLYSGLAACLMGILFLGAIVGASNAVNLTDGLDGLAAGTVIMVASAFAAIAFVTNNLDLARYLNILYIEGSGEIAIFLASVAGACLGFLWYNAHPAQVFMGDTGSLPLGAILGVSAICLGRTILLALIGGVFVVEAISVMLQVGSYRLRDKKRIFLCAPLHHHFEYKGWAETKVVIRFWIIGLLLAIVGIGSLKFQ
ncbi:MAG: phospho-N-acetylmuramoyl-pentapeptide-transferase, partial [Chlamydiae bacterium]|nr:phospho-N-acetylmuramoyl-pentapeptide-transferase [Chlamydiota bacterium]